MARFFAWLIEIQAPWAKPLGDFNKRWIAWIVHRLGPFRDLLHGRWLGHPLHAVMTDAPIGALTLALVFDVLDLRPAADISLIAGVIFMLGAAVTGAVDYADTDGTPLWQATVHSLVMVVSLVVYVVSLLIRAGEPADRTLAVVTNVLGYLLIVAGAYVGGHVAYALGNMVSRHVFTPRGTKWQPLQLDKGTELAEGTLTRVRLGNGEPLVLVRLGDTIHALHEKCAHAGGPLAEGTIVDGCIQCPWHGSRFRLSDGLVRRGPAVYDQPRYEVRRTDAGWEARRAG